LAALRLTTFVLDFFFDATRLLAAAIFFFARGLGFLPSAAVVVTSPAGGLADLAALVSIAVETLFKTTAAIALVVAAAAAAASATSPTNSAFPHGYNSFLRTVFDAFTRHFYSSPLPPGQLQRDYTYVVCWHTQ
jgi:hypothetical protein